MSIIVLASQNKDKIAELQSTLASLGIELKSTYDFPDLKEVVEDQDSLRGNALKKARYVFGATGLPALADDTGLEVEALDGRPGVYSARYAGRSATYQNNVDKLLDEMSELEPKNRGAQFRTVIALVANGGDHTFSGVCRGTILEEKKGTGGFGYDPIFQPEGYEQTFAEMDTDIKNQISHRAKAIQKFIDWLKKQ